jgi:hypothetical protein
LIKYGILINKLIKVMTVDNRPDYAKLAAGYHAVADELFAAAQANPSLLQPGVNSDGERLPSKATAIGLVRHWAIVYDNMSRGVPLASITTVLR